MNLKLRVYGIDGDDAAELEELLWSIPEISDVRTGFRTRDPIPLGTIHASATSTVMTCAITYVALKFADEAIKDAYEVAKKSLLARLSAWQAEKNSAVEPKHRIYFTLSENGEYIVQGED